MQVALPRSLESALTERDGPSPAAPAEFTAMGPEMARLAMSDTEAKTGSEE
jgi:hypothetical protein